MSAKTRPVASPLTRLAGAALLGAWAVGVSAQQSPGSAGAPASILLAPAAPASRSPYLDASPSVRTAVVAPGKPFTIAVDVAPKTGMHVYAPGNAGYDAVALVIDAQTGIAAGDVKYPPPETFYFAPLKERWRVYSAPFALSRPITIGTSPAAALALSAAPVVTIKGRLTYQACDDKVCYLPQSVPLTWTVTIRR